MLVRTSPTNVSDTDYLGPQPIKRVAPSTTATTTAVRQDDINPNV
jgi:hypothetical protein